MNKTAKNSIIYLFGTGVMAVLGFVSTMLLTRILSKQVYAQYGLLTTFTTAAVAVISFGLDASYTRFFYKNGHTPIHFFLKCMRLPIILLAVFGIVLIEPNRFLLTYLFDDAMTFKYAMAIFAYIAFTLVHRFTQATARMEEYAMNYIVSNIISKSGFIAFVCTVYFLTKDVTFLCVVGSFAFAGAISILINLIVFKKEIKSPESGTETVSSKELVKYGFPFMINNSFILIIPVVEKLIIKRLAGWEMLGIYTAASVFYTVVALMQNTIDNIWNPIVYKHCDDEKYFKPILHDFGLIVTVLTSAVLAFCILLRHWLVLILDKSYYTTYIITPAIMYTSCFNIIMIVYSVGINVQKKTRYLIISPIIQITVSLSLCFLLIPKLGLIGIGMASLASIVLSRLYRIMVGLKLYGTDVKETKCYLIWLFCLIAVMASMFFTSVVSDIIVFLILIFLVIAVINRDAATLYKRVLELVKKR